MVFQLLQPNVSAVALCCCNNMFMVFQLFYPNVVVVVPCCCSIYVYDVSTVSIYCCSSLFGVVCNNIFTMFQLLQPNVSAVVLFFCCNYGVAASNVFSELFSTARSSSMQATTSSKCMRAAGACEHSSIAAGACE
jgi:hypothetical protein